MIFLKKTKTIVFSYFQSRRIHRQRWCANSHAFTYLPPILDTKKWNAPERIDNNCTFETKMAYFSEEYLRFFIDLAPNNHKEWFDANRKRYEEHVKKPFHDFIKHLISRFQAIDSSFSELEPKDCIFRINRDVRFAKDKSPYKLMMSAVISPKGKKDTSINGVYFELTPEYLRVYGGIYEIEKDDLYEAREAIAKDLRGFEAAITDPTFVKVYGEIRGEKNKVLPKELKAAAEKQPLIYNKQWYFFTEFPPETILEERLDGIIMSCYEAGRPVEEFFQKRIGSVGKL